MNRLNFNVIKGAFILSLFLCSTASYTQDDSLTWDGLNRYYRVHVPASYSPTTATSLIIAIHGGFGSGPLLETQSQLSVKSDQEGFIVVYPDGVRNTLGIRTWNAGGCCGSSVANNVDDVGFINTLIDSIVAKYAIDGDKIYLTGMSNGAFMSYRLACELSETIAAIAPVSGTMNVKDCNSIRNVPIIHFHSYLDESVPHLGGTGYGISSHHNPPLHSVLTAWKGKNNCINQDTIQNDTDLLHIKWSSCQCNSNIQLYLTHDGGHSWHGGQKTGLGDATSTVVNANDKMWDFFNANPKCSISSVQQTKNKIIVSPNPFTSNLNISVNQTNFGSQFILYNSLGVSKTEGTLSSQKGIQQINTKNLQGGLYFLTVQTVTGLLTIKVVKH